VKFWFVLVPHVVESAAVECCEELRHENNFACRVVEATPQMMELYRVSKVGTP